ncbi:AfsR/SARP family transcriptional regulator [Streptomyces jumonjinensis]|uniref:AfsR/SARP family transcriptional regulator n=2 Tax=Streptomyces jumonjinensis TaxID=1945 RepID=UPI00379E9784
MTDGGMRFSVLGGLEWFSQGVALRIGRRRERLLLGLLLLDIGRVVPANRLIDLLWDEREPPSSARGSLQVHVSRLRGRFLEAEAARYGFALTRASDGYLVEGDPLAVDLHSFRSLVQKAERTDDAAERLRLIERALAEWGGPVLAGTASDALVRRLGTGFDELYLSAVTQRAEARLALGQRGVVLEELARATAEHPHHERLAMLRMIALYRADHRGEALEVFNETRARLAEELGLDPGADLQRVHALILRADTALLEGGAVPGREAARGDGAADGSAADRTARDGADLDPAERGRRSGGRTAEVRPASGHEPHDGPDPSGSGREGVDRGGLGRRRTDHGGPGEGGVYRDGTRRGGSAAGMRRGTAAPEGAAAQDGAPYDGAAYDSAPYDNAPYDDRGPDRRTYDRTGYDDRSRDGGADERMPHGGSRSGDPALDRAPYERGSPDRPPRDSAPAGPGRSAEPSDGDPAPARAEAESVQRISRTGGFIGREVELAQLTSLVEGALGRSGVVMIVGPAGSGKTALALQWCRGTNEAFPDGQLFLDLRGHSDESPMSPKEALSGLLRALGVPYQDIPHAAAEMAELYQRNLAGRRVLIVLDNAESADQVRQLLPYEDGCLALVTSRNRLGAMIVSHGAAMLPLHPLASFEAEELVRCVVGDDRAAAEPEALGELVAICGRTPLALRIAAANLALRPDFRIADQVRDLRSGNPLESLAVAGDPDSAVRRAFELSYRRLDPEAAEAFRMLGLLPGPATTVAAVSALLGRSPGSAYHLLDRLFAEHLVERNGQERLRLHDLIWWYARLLVDPERTRTVHREAHGRLLHWYTASADAAARSLYPQILRLDPDPLRPGARPETFDGPQQAADWFDAERADLVRLIEAETETATGPGPATGTGTGTGVGTGAGTVPDGEPSPAVWILADTLRGYFWLRRDAETWIRVATVALRAARGAEDFRGQAAAHQSLGLATFTTGDLELARGHFEQAIELAREAGWGVCESVALSNLAGVSADMGLLSQAAEYYDQSITIDRRLRRTPHQPLQGLSEVLYGMGRLREAERLCRRALALSRKMSAPDSIARVSTTLALISLDLGQLEAARELATASRTGFQGIGNLAGEAEAVCALAMIAAEGGDGTGALRAALTACRLSRKAGRPRLKLEAMLAMGHARYQLGQYERAYEHFRIARVTAEETGYLKGRTMALLGLGVCAARVGRPAEALGHAGAALTAAQESQLRLLEGQAQAVLAVAQACRGDLVAAVRAARQAEAIHMTTGYRPVHSPFGPPAEGLDQAAGHDAFRRLQEALEGQPQP